jgi:hypothetical protein
VTHAKVSKAVLLAAAAVAAFLLAGCGSQKDAGGLTAGDRNTAQAVLNTLHESNIAVQLVAISNNVQAIPAACRVHLLRNGSGNLHVYVFWVPWLGGEDYTWLNMTIAKDTSKDRFQLGLEHPVLPGGRLSQNGTGVVPGSNDTTLLSLYGPQQARKSHELLVGHAGDAFSKPGANCQVLRNGDIRLLPNNASKRTTKD